MSLKIKVPNIIYLGSAVPSGGGGGSAKQVALLSITTAPSGTFEKGSQYYNSLDKKIYTAIADNTWENASPSDPQFNTYYIYNNQTYVWDGNSLELFELEEYQKKLVSGENIKTINGDSVLGSGNLAVKTYQVFPSSWHTTTTFSEFLNDINSDNTAVEGMAYLGDLACSGLPTGIGNAEVVVEIINSTTNTKCIHVILTSGDVNPYRWEYTYWNNGSSVSGWIGFQPELTAGENISIQDNTISAVDTKPNLFDIKTLSQAIAGEEEKGWACLSHTTRKDIAKAKVPTLYKDIKDKYDNIPTELQPIQTLSGSTYSGRVYVDDTYIYFLGTDRYLRRCPLNNISSTTIENYLNNYQINAYNRDWYVGKNIVVICSPNNGFIIINKSNNTVLDYLSKLNWCMDLSITKENGKTFVYATTSNDGNNRNYITYRIEDKEYTSETFTYETYNFYLEREQHTFNSIKYINGNYFFVSKLSYYGRVSIITIGNNFANISDLSKWVWKADDDNYGVIANSNIIITRYYISYDGGETFSSNNNLFPNNRTPQFFNCLNENICYFSEYHYPSDLYSFTYENNTLTRTTIISNTVTLYDRVNNIVDDGNSFLISPTSATLIYSTVSKIVSTDTYQINGSSVAINYYKCDDWKICLPDVSNDTNLDIVYEYLGYHNYWRINTTNETISLPRNSNLWTMMYVGDDYEDSNLPSGEYSAVALKSETKYLIKDVAISSTITINLDEKYKAYQITTPTSNFSLSIDNTNCPIGKEVKDIILIIDMSASSQAYEITWANNIQWGNTSPTMTALVKYMFSFTTIDGGQTWIGNQMFSW